MRALVRRCSALLAGLTSGWQEFAAERGRQLHGIYGTEPARAGETDASGTPAAE